MLKLKEKSTDDNFDFLFKNISVYEDFCQGRKIKFLTF